MITPLHPANNTDPYAPIVHSSHLAPQPQNCPRWHPPHPADWHHWPQAQPSRYVKAKGKLTWLHHLGTAPAGISRIQRLRLCTTQLGCSAAGTCQAQHGMQLQDSHMC